jgi:hypothetical protein
MTIPQLKSALIKTWKKHSELKKEMAPWLSELRERLRKQGNRKGEGWAAWLNEGHIGISLKTANRWADQHEGKKRTSSQKSRSGLKARAAEAPVWKFAAPPTPWFNKERQQELHQAIEIVGDIRALQLFFDAVTQAAAQRATVANEALATHA